MQKTARLVLWASTMTMGLMAGLFFAFTISVMPGLARTDDAVFVAAMQNINQVIENVVFGLVFAGALIFTAIAALLQRLAGQRVAARWIVAALVLYLVTLGITMGVNVPLNNELAAKGIRADFEGTWVTANAIRTVTCVLAFACLSWASLLIREARATVESR